MLAPVGQAATSGDGIGLAGLHLVAERPVSIAADETQGRASGPLGSLEDGQREGGCRSQRQAESERRLIQRAAHQGGAGGLQFLGGFGQAGRLQLRSRITAP